MASETAALAEMVRVRSHTWRMQIYSANIRCIAVCMVKSGSCFPCLYADANAGAPPKQRLRFCCVFKVQERLTIELPALVGSAVTPPYYRDVSATVRELFSFPCRDGDAQ